MGRLNIRASGLPWFPNFSNTFNSSLETVVDKGLEVYFCKKKYSHLRPISFRLKLDPKNLDILGQALTNSHNQFLTQNRQQR